MDFIGGPMITTGSEPSGTLVNKERYLGAFPTKSLVSSRETPKPPDGVYMQLCRTQGANEQLMHVRSLFSPRNHTLVQSKAAHLPKKRFLEHDTQVE